MNRKYFLSLTTAIALFATGCGGEKEKSKKPELDPLAQKAIESGLKAIPTDTKELYKIIDNPQNRITPEKVEFGKKLYFDPRLSKSNLISCNTCHNLALGGDDDIPVATGHMWRANPHHLNSPTVYNAVFNSSQFWDGRATDLEHQAQGPILAGPEMASTKEIVINTVKSIPEYVEDFKKAFGNTEITYEKITSAIGTFERTLVTPSRFDDFLNGDSTALSAEEREGLKLFIDKGCASCHSGYGIGGASMQKFPLIKPYKYANLGDFKGNKDGMVKVPTLRNITETAPYFHNGATWSLHEAVEIMGETQLGIKLSSDEVDKIVTFLGSLEGRKPKIEYPILPASSEKTPKPDME